jgi:hypothetical protein
MCFKWCKKRTNNKKNYIELQNQNYLEDETTLGDFFDHGIQIKALNQQNILLTYEVNLPQEKDLSIKKTINQHIQHSIKSLLKISRSKIKQIKAPNQRELYVTILLSKKQLNDLLIDIECITDLRNRDFPITNTYTNSIVNRHITNRYINWSCTQKYIRMF